MSDLVKVHNSDEQADALAQKLPDGDAFSAKYIEDCNIRKWLIALGQEWVRLEEYMNYVHTDMVLSSTDDLITDWEKEYAMNANCFSQLDSQTLQERINNILTLILSNGTSTEEQFEELATILGYDVNVSCCKTQVDSGFPYTFPITFTDAKSDRFVIYVDVNGSAPDSNVFPYTFPITFTESATNLLECFFNVLKPAHTIIIFNYTS